MPPGTYIIMIDPFWKEQTVNNDHQYSDVLIDIYSPAQVYVELMDYDLGFSYFVRACKDAAITMSPIKPREYYLQSSPQNGADVFRVSDLETLECRYGYIYTENNSQTPIQETMNFQLQGLEIVYPEIQTNQAEGENSEEVVEVSVEPHNSHIIIFR